MSDAQLAVQEPQPFVKASSQLSAWLGVEPGMMIETIKRQCFRGMNADQVSDAQLAAFVSVANSLKVNPLLPGFLYAFPDRNGSMTPIIGPDAVFKMLTEHPEVDSWETTVYPEDVALAPTHATTKIYRKGREKPISYTALYSEWRMPNNPVWAGKPRHMLGLRSLKQAGRQIIHGIPFDEDEFKMTQMVNVTPEGATEAPAAVRPPPPAREAQGAALVKENSDKKRGKKTEAAIDVAATPAAETHAPPPANAAPTVPPIGGNAQAPESKPAAGNPAPAGTAEPRTVLNAGETATFVCEVESFICQPVNGVPAVKAVVKGQFAGTVYHLNGAVVKLDKESVEKLVELPAWQIENPVKLTLLGKPGAKPGMVFSMVQAIELAESKGEVLE